MIEIPGEGLRVDLCRMNFSPDGEINCLYLSEGWHYCYGLSRKPDSICIDGQPCDAKPYKIVPVKEGK